MLPKLREGHAQVTKELAEERVLVAEIESADPDYLNELKTSIAEQACVSFLLYCRVGVLTCVRVQGGAGGLPRGRRR
jgi:hypothetical protein